MERAAVELASAAAKRALAAPAVERALEAPQALIGAALLHSKLARLLARSCSTAPPRAASCDEDCGCVLATTALVACSNDRMAAAVS